MEILNEFSKLFVLDIRNTMGILFWGNLILAILIFAFRLTITNYDTQKLLFIFGSSKIIQSFAWLAFFSRTNIDVNNPIALVLPNSLIFASYYLESIALLMLFKHKKSKTFKTQLIIFIFSLLSFYCAVWLKAPENIRVSLVSVNIFLLLIYPTSRFLKEARKSLFKKALVINYIVFLSVIFFRIVYPLIHPSTRLYSVETVQKFTFLIIFQMMIISGVGYLLLLQEEKEILVKKLLDDKNKFFSIIAHDLRGPFNGIIGLSELLLEKENKLDTQETNTFIELINESSKNAFNLLDNLLTWAQSQTGILKFNPEIIEVSAIIDKTIHLLENIAKNKNITILSEIKNEEYIVADHNMLETIFRNLISNAIKFTNFDGEVVLSMKKEKNEIIFSIKDNGIGIDPEKLETLFEINHKNSTPGTDNELGTGLGLMLCKDFIEKHGGKIWVESKIGQGSTFLFNILQTKN